MNFPWGLVIFLCPALCFSQIHLHGKSAAFSVIIWCVCVVLHPCLTFNDTLSLNALPYPFSSPYLPLPQAVLLLRCKVTWMLWRFVYNTHSKLPLLQEFARINCVLSVYPCTCGAYILSNAEKYIHNKAKFWEIFELKLLFLLRLNIQFFKKNSNFTT